MKILNDYLKRALCCCLCWLAAQCLVAAGFDDGVVIDYHPFNDSSITFKLTQHKGKYVEILLPPSWETALTAQEKRTLLDNADIFYFFYKEILKDEPLLPSLHQQPRETNGLLRIAVHNHLPYPAWASNGYRELEILDDAANLQAVKDELSQGIANRRFLVHEMGHTFDLYSNYLAYEGTCNSGTNWCHAWTDIWDAFIPFYGRVGGIHETIPTPNLFLTPDEHQRWWTNHSYLPYYTNPNANWTNAVKSEGFLASGVTARDTWAGIMDRYVQLYGVQAMVKTMDYLKTYKANNAAPATPEAKEHLHIAAMAAGANANLGCFLDEWRWYSSAALRNEMTTLYGAPQNNAFCKDNDADKFTPLQGDCNDSSAAVNPSAVESQNGIDDNCNGFVDDLTPPAPTPVPLAPWASLDTPAKQGNTYQLHSTTLSLFAPIVNELPTHIRFWVTGVGIVATVPYSQDAFYSWTPAAGLVAGTYGYRAQLMSGNKPVSDFTPIKWFELGDPCTENRYEAETMYHSVGNAYVQGWNVYGNGYISFTHNFTNQIQQMTVRAAGQNGGGWPNMRVTVGGVQVFNGVVATSQWSDFTFSFFTQPGTAEVRVEFTNDYFVQPPGQQPIDRNLFVDKVTLASQCGSAPMPINLGPLNNETKFPVNGAQPLVINQLFFDGWTPTQIVVGIGHTDAANLNGVSVSVNGGAPIALSGDWRTISIPYTGQSTINLTIFTTTPRAIRTLWWATQ